MDALNRAVEDIRCYIFDLKVAEESLELETVLEDLVCDLQLDTYLEVDLEVLGQRCCVLSSQQMGHVTQIAREALSNVVQHADATHVNVRLNYLGYCTQLTVSDNGNGANVHTATNGAYQGQGITNMQARARMLGGRLDLKSMAGQGFQLVLTIPCDGQTVLDLDA
jgi:two-component system NarL family sensor kinase